MPTPYKLLLLTTLYLSQGLPYGFFTKALPVLMREQGVSLTAIGFASALAAPWMLKFLWAPWVDRLGSSRIGRRRSWILPTQLGAILLLLGVARLDPAQQLAAVLVAILVANLLAATQDVATDGLAVSLLSEPERGWGNGVQVAGYRLGMILGGGVLLVLCARLGWERTFAAMAGILALATLPIAAYREPASDPPPKLNWSQAWRTFLQRPAMAPWLVLLVAYKFGEQLGGGVTTPLFVDRGLDMEDVGWMIGLTGSAASLAGALFGGALVGTLGRRRALLVFGLLQAAGIALYVLPAQGHADLATLYAITVADGVVGSMATAALFTAMMDACDPARGATEYTAQASVVVAGSGLGMMLSGVSADLLGYTAHFVLSAVLTALGAVWMWKAFALPDRAQS